MKRIALVPTLLTLANGVCGFISIALASKIYPADVVAADMHFALAGWFIIAAMVFDIFDGQVARLSKTASRFGG